MYNALEEQRRTLIYDVALAIYTVDYLNKHRHEWETPELEERMTNPAYIRGRFDAHQGLVRYQQFIDQAKASINIAIETAARRVEAASPAFPHAACKRVAVPDFGTGGFVTGQHPFPITPWTGEHNDDCPYTIAARLRDLK
ncbi:MAG: hypothetical protein WBE13_09040 [Candidatus Acidiferrum sp.]